MLAWAEKKKNPEEQAPNCYRWHSWWLITSGVAGWLGLQLGRFNSKPRPGEVLSEGQCLFTSEALHCIL